MALIINNAPVPSDYSGVLWALAGIKNALILEHGATGTAFYNAVSFGVMNRQSPKGLLFTTGLDEDDVVMGREDKIIEAVMELDQTYHPQIISLAATAVTSVIGLDLDGLRKELQPRVSAKLLAFCGGGFNGDYTAGIKEVFCTLVKEVVDKPSLVCPRTVNLIGPTIDSFNHPSDFAEIKRLLELMNIRVNAVFTQSIDVDQIKNISSAALNIVTRDLGLEAARLLEATYETPYYYGQPFGLKGTVEFLKQIASRLDLSVDHKMIVAELKTYGHTLPELSSFWQRYDHLKVVVACPYDYAVGLTRFIQTEWNFEVKAVVLPIAPEDDAATEKLSALKVETVVVAPEEKDLKDLLATISPDILFGSTYDFRLAPRTPVKILAAMPAYDYIYLYDGTPFVGFRGSLYLTQTMVNLLNASRKGT